eukprot:1195620-Prorocentrum_minimum.AAC.2
MPPNSLPGNGRALRVWSYGDVVAGQLVRFLASLVASRDEPSYVLSKPGVALAALAPSSRLAEKVTLHTWSKAALASSISCRACCSFPSCAALWASSAATFSACAVSASRRICGPAPAQLLPQQWGKAKANLVQLCLLAMRGRTRP